MHTIMKNKIAKMVLTNNFWGLIFSRIECRSSPTMEHLAGVGATENGNIILYYNADKLKICPDNTIDKILEHEGMHLLNKHIQRFINLSVATNYDKNINIQRIFNIACDCCVNTQINMPRKLDVGDKFITLCFPDIYGLPEKQITEYYFSELMKNKDVVNQNTFKTIYIDGMIGDHSKWGDVLSKVTDVNALVRKINNSFGDVLKDVTEKLKRRGSIPSYMEELINNYLRPPILPYYQLIRKLVNGSRWAKNKPSSTRVNRKRSYSFYLKEMGIAPISPFPGKTKDISFKIGILIDTSGSMGNEDLEEALSSIKNIIEKDRNSKVIVIENDTEIKKEYTVKKISDIQPKVLGRGGTTLLPGLVRFKKLNMDVILVFTDGWCENINNIDRKILPKKIIWVVPNNGTINNVNKIGYQVRYDLKSQK